MVESLARSRARLVAGVLTGSWRRTPPPLNLSASELDDVTPLLLGSGASALGWWRVRSSGLRAISPASELQQAYRLLVIEDALHERKIKKVLTLLRSEGIEPLLAKGWAVARLYPEQALRPYGDIDLCVPPHKFEVAREVLKRPEARDCWVDLHDKFTELGDRGLDELYARSQLVKLDDVYVRVLGPEDHFALLAVHWLKHGAWRPLGLCDIGAAIESRPADFDWELCLGLDQRRAKWIKCTIGLARKLLGAEIEDIPVAEEAQRLPRWLIRAVLKEWETPFAVNQAPMKYPVPMLQQLRHPAGLLQGLRDRWPNPIKATIDMNWPLNEVPRLPFQLGYCLSRVKQFLTELPAER